MQLNLFQSSNTYKLDFLNSITICNPFYIKLKVKSSIFSHSIRKSQEHKERSSVSALSQDVSPNIVNALQKERFAEFSVNAKIAKILVPLSILIRPMFKKDVSAPSRSVKKIIANAFRKVSLVQKNVVAQIAKITNREYLYFFLILPIKLYTKQ